MDELIDGLQVRITGLQAQVARLTATITEQQAMINTLSVLAEERQVDSPQADALDGWKRTLLLNRELQGRIKEVGEAEQLLRSVVDSLDSRLCILGENGVILGANRLWVRLADQFGWGPETAGEGGDFFALLQRFGAELAAPVSSALRRVLAGGTGELSVKAPVRLRDREDWVVVRMHPVRDHETARAVVTIIDITEAHRTQQALDRETSLLSGVLASIPQLVYWKDEQLRYTGVNEAFLEVRGLGDREQVIGRLEAELADVPAGELAGELAGLEAHVLATGERVENHRVVLRPALDAPGPARSLLLSVLPQTDPGGVVRGVIGVAADVTHVTTLEQQVAQATRLESIGQLAAGIAHEINTPVQYVSDNTRFLAQTFEGVLQALRAARAVQGEVETARLREQLAELDLDFLAEEIPGALSQSQEGLARVAQIVRAMKDFSHPGQGRAEADLNRAVESTTQVCRNEWRYVARLELDLDPGVGLLRCHEGELKQVLLNVVVNAAQAITEQREQTGADRLGLIRVTTRRTGQGVRITVEDDGPGMEPAVQRRVFDPFFTTKPVGKGTGQGLSMAYATVVTKHAGSIALDSTPGRGTTVTIDLPDPPPTS